MSRFFTTGSDSESESSLSGEELVTKPVGGNYGKQPLLLSEDEEDTKRVVRSAKDKRFEELTNLIRTIRNAMKIRDVTKCLEEFELLGKAYGKAKSIVDKEGVPRFYIRILADLEDYLNELWEDKEGKKKMNKNNAKALSTLRQKIRKYNRDFESHITNYKQNPEQSADEDAEKNEEDSEGSSDEDEDEDGVSAAAFLKKKAEAPSGESRKFLKRWRTKTRIRRTRKMTKSGTPVPRLQIRTQRRKKGNKPHWPPDSLKGPHHRGGQEGRREETGGQSQEEARQEVEAPG